MASAILTSAKRGAYLAIGLYLVLVCFVSISAHTQHDFETPIQVAYPAIQFEHRVQNAVVDHPDVAGVAGS